MNRKIERENRQIAVNGTSNAALMVTKVVVMFFVGLLIVDSAE